MSLEALSWALKVQGVTPAQKAVLVSMANAADPEGYTYIGQKRIGRESCCSRRTVQEALKALERAGLIRREERRRANGSRQNDDCWLQIHTQQGADAAPCEEPQGAGNAPPGAREMRPHPNRHKQPSDPSPTEKAAGTAAIPHGIGSKSPEAKLFRLGARVLGPRAAGVVRQLREAMRDDQRCAEVLEAAEGKHDARAYVMGCIQSRPPPIDYDAIEQRVAERERRATGDDGMDGNRGES